MFSENTKRLLFSCSHTHLWTFWLSWELTHEGWRAALLCASYGYVPWHTCSNFGGKGLACWQSYDRLVKGCNVCLTMGNCQSRCGGNVTDGPPGSQGFVWEKECWWSLLVCNGAEVVQCDVDVSRSRSGSIDIFIVNNNNIWSFEGCPIDRHKLPVDRKWSRYIELNR